MNSAALQEMRREKLKTGSAVAVDFSLTGLPFSAGIYFLFPLLTLKMNEITEWMILKLIPNSDTQILQTPFLNQSLSYISFSGGVPTLKGKFFFAILAALTIAITKKMNFAIPYKLISYFFSSLILASCAVLLLFPTAFPYTIGSFAEINMKLQVLLWLIFPIMLSLLLLQITPTIPKKISFMAALMGLTLILSTVKYTFCLYVLMKCSFILTPVLFFIFGPYMDLMYLVSFFALFTSRLKT